MQAHMLKLLSAAQLLLVLVLVLPHACHGVFRVITPEYIGEDDAGGLNAGMAHQLALFGRAADADARDLVAPLVLAPPTNRRACSAFDRTEMQQVLVDSGVVLHNSSQLAGNDSADVLAANSDDAGDGAAEQAFVLLVERGGCHFVEKVRHAQEALAVGVAIYNAALEDDEDNGGALPPMGDDGTAGDIRIPSVLIYHSDALKLMGMLHSAQKTVVLLNWHAPNPDHRVDVALWFSSRSSPALHSFIKPLTKIVQAFEDEQQASVRMQFTPYYDVFEGSTWGCLGSSEATTGGSGGGAPGSSNCEKLCVYDDKFCAYDPERDASVGLDGKDVLEEDIRQLCIAQYAQQQQTGKTNKTALFWEYVATFDSKCSPVDATTNEFSDECSRQVQASLGIPESQVRACVRDQGESLLSEQLRAKHKFGVLAVPQLTVNSVPFHGSLACDEPIALAACAPLRAICDGFEGNSAPQACTEAFWRETCFAPLETDDCGDCNPRESLGLWNRKCAGCDGVPHSGKDLDECGVCGGNGSFDVCGRCLPQEDAMRGKSCVDCKGVPNGSAQRDACGVCDGHGSFDVCGLCLDASDPRRQNGAHCRVIEDPDAVKGKAQITGVHASQFRGAMLESFQQAIGAAAGVSAKDVLLKSIDDGIATSDGEINVQVFFFVACKSDACRTSTAKLLQDPSASLTVAMKMRAHLDEVAYGLDEAASIERVHLHSISASPGIADSVMVATQDAAAEGAMAGSHNGLSPASSWGIVLGALCLATLLAGFIALKARDDRIRRDFQQMFAAYTPLTSLDQEDERENGLFA